ncbi:MAG: cytochrome P460 family protein [Hyphomicrobiales bacterium]
MMRSLSFLFGLIFVFTLDSAQSQNATEEHFMAPNPAQLEGQAAEDVYLKLLDAMTEGYRLSRRSTAEDYLDWKRYNTAPYRSATHGRRFVNNYANMISKDYAKYEKAGEMPEGAVIAKDSFTVTEEGNVSPGPLFIMRKMQAGFNAASGDWRYSMIMPDGSFFGETNGEGAQQVKFCIGCHAAVKKNDHLFFVPDKYRK